MADAAQPRPIEDVGEISAITYGFMASKALFAALEFDVFTHIAQGADTTSALAEITGIAQNRLITLLAALKSVGLISEGGGRLINAPATSRYLVAGAPGDFRDYVRYVNGAFGYESFRHLDEALRGDRIFPDKGFYEGLIYEGGIGGERFSSAQHTGSLGPARLMAKRVDLKDRRKLLDVGGGSGAYSIAFCGANPELSATILDFPETVDTAKPICARGRTRRSDRASRGQRGRRRLAGGTRRHPHVLRLERGRRDGYRHLGKARRSRASARWLIARARLHG